MKIPNTLLVTILGVFVLLATASPSDADCCYEICGARHAAGTCIYLTCGTCEAPTPFCGRGSCNFIGCHCKGGCWPADCTGCENQCIPLAPDLPSSLLTGDSNRNHAIAINVFRSIDEDNSGSLSEEEVLNWAEDNLSPEVDVSAGFRETDENGDGELELREYDPDVAAWWSQNQPSGE